MSDETGEDVKSRFARRFEDDGDESGEDERSMEDVRPGADRNAMNAGTKRKSKRAKNVKKEWNAKSVYLPDEIERSLSRTYKKLDWQLDEDEGISIKKTRHYYPLIVRLGLERVESMESTEIKERLEALED
jgi:hypothetical protein